MTEEDELLLEDEEKENRYGKNTDDKNVRIAKIENRVKKFGGKITALLETVQFISKDYDEMKIRNESQKDEIKKLRTNLNSVEIEQKKNKK